MPMGRDVRGWPLLYGSGKNAGFSYIVTPRSFIRAKILSDISSATNEVFKRANDGLNRTTRPTYRVDYVSEESEGQLEFVLILRVTPATAALVGEQPTQPLLDDSKRRFSIIEGIVFNDKDSFAPDPIPDELWQSFEEDMIPYYRQYYYATQSMRPFIFDEPMKFRLHGDGGGANLATIQLESRLIPGDLDWAPATEQEIAQEQKARTGDASGVEASRQESQDKQAAANPLMTRGLLKLYIGLISVLIVVVLIIILLILARVPLTFTGN